jgi:hypothetical protein
MTDKPRPIRLNSETHRAFVASLVLSTPIGHFISIEAPTRGLKQNSAYHTALRDIAEQVEWHGRKLSELTWKRLTMASWLRSHGFQPELIPALDGNGFDIVFEHSSKLKIPEMSELLMWTYQFGDEQGVKFKERT